MFAVVFVSNGLVLIIPVLYRGHSAVQCSVGDFSHAGPSSGGKGGGGKYTEKHERHSRSFTNMFAVVFVSNGLVLIVPVLHRGIGVFPVEVDVSH